MNLAISQKWVLPDIPVASFGYRSKSTFWVQSFQTKHMNKKLKYLKKIYEFPEVLIFMTKRWIVLILLRNLSLRSLITFGNFSSVYSEIWR